MTDRFLAQAYPALLAALLLVWAAAARACGPALKRELSPVLGRRGAAALLAVFAAALAARLALPAGHRVFFDEYEHVDIASHVARTGDLAECAASGPGLDALEPSPWPGLFHVALGAVFRVAGPSERAAYRFNAASGALAALAAGLAAALLFGDAAGAFAAAALLAAFPPAVAYSTTADLTAFASLWLALSLLALELCARRPGRATRVFLLATLACAAHARFENGVLLVVAAWRLRKAGALRTLFSGAEGAASLAAFAAVLSPLALIVWRNRASAVPGFDEPVLAGLRHLAAQAPADVRWLLSFPAEWLLVVPALAAAGFRPSRSEKAGLGALLLASLLYLAVYGSFFRGDFSRGTEDRYAVCAMLPLLLACACGVKRLPFPERGRWSAAAAALFLAAGLSWDSYRPPLEPAHAAEDAFLHGPVAALPEGVWAAAFSAPAVSAAAGRPVVSLAALARDWPSWRARLEGRPVALLEDFWWTRKPAEAARARRLLSEGRDERVLAESALDGAAYRLVLFSPSAARASSR